MRPRSDPTRSLVLLWGADSAPGRSGLSVKSIVAAAMDIADAEGLAAASMRRVAQRLGVGTMSTYTHVPGKAELTDLMLDTALGELYADVDEPANQPGGWRGSLTFIAERNWDLHQRHPWLLEAASGRPGLGPQSIRKYEAELRALDGIGLSDVQMDSVLTLVLTHVEGVARTQASLAQSQEGSGMTEDEWWRSTAPVLERLLDGRLFPIASRVGQAAGEQYQAAADPVHAFTFGLERILDGVERLMQQQAGPAA